MFNRLSQAIIFKLSINIVKDVSREKLPFEKEMLSQSLIYKFVVLFLFMLILLLYSPRFQFNERENYS